MNVALLFDAGHASLGNWSGGAVMHRILGANVLQVINRHMRVSVGDVLTFGASAASKQPTRAGLVELCQQVYKPTELDLLLPERLEATFAKTTVFCWLFQNMTAEIAKDLHSKLQAEAAYLGIMDVNLADPLHAQFFRNSLVESYRLRGKKCSVLYNMGENEDPDVAVQEILEEHGIQVDYEDIGARQTIFDDYDSAGHFKRVEDFKRLFSTLGDLSADDVSDLALTLEELHPRLFDALASAARTLGRAETAEDLAQAATSGRRLLEKVADYLFPPQQELWKGRSVGRPQFRNRLWAYLDRTITDRGLEPNLLQPLGKELDRLVELFNAGLHADPTRKKLEHAFRDLVLWLTKVIELSPSDARRPYLAYGEEMTTFMRRVLDDAEGEEENPSSTESHSRSS